MQNIEDAIISFLEAQKSCTCEQCHVLRESLGLVLQMNGMSKITKIALTELSAGESTSLILQSYETLMDSASQFIEEFSAKAELYSKTVLLELQKDNVIDITAVSDAGLAKIEIRPKFTQQELPTLNIVKGNTTVH